MKLSELQKHMSSHVKHFLGGLVRVPGYVLAVVSAFPHFAIKLHFHQTMSHVFFLQKHNIYLKRPLPPVT